MDCVSFEALSEYFETKVANLAKSFSFRDVCEDDECLQQFQLLEGQVEGVASIIPLLQTELDKQRDKLEQLKEMCQALHKLKVCLTYTVENIPTRLPKPAQERVTLPMTKSSSHKSTNQVRTNLTSATNPSVATPPAEILPMVVKNENTYYPEIDYLVVDEFDALAKYLKGRLKYDQINKFIEGMNKAYRAKYKLMKQKKSSMNDASRKRHETYKSQENKDTKGCYFIVDDDIKEYGQTKIDNVARSILTILRHCGRCKEVRGGHLTRYVYIASY